MIANIPSRQRRGFTLVELLVVITVIAILASMVIPAIGFVRELANKAKCGKNQNGIFTALLAYNDGGDTGWPDARWKLSSGTPSSSTNTVTAAEGVPAAQYSCAIFEILAAASPESVPASLFKCPSQTGLTFGPDTSMRASLSRANTNWGWSTNKIPYAMDWSAPADSGAVRALLSDRDPENHKGKEAVVCFADGHYKAIKCIKDGSATGGFRVSTGGKKTMGLFSEVNVIVENQDAKGGEGRGDEDTFADNIFDDDQDYSTSGSSGGGAGNGSQNRTLTAGAGSGRRAYMK